MRRTVIETRDCQEGKPLLSKNLGPNAEMVVNEKGGMGSKVDCDLTLIDPIALMRTAQVMGVGARRYARDNWRLISVEDHLNHMLIHTYAYLAGDTQDDHLGHMMARGMMAVAVQLRPNYLGAMEGKVNKQGVNDGNKNRKSRRLRHGQSRKLRVSKAKS